MIASGNASDEGKTRGGWFLGSFIPDAPLHREGIEIKWANHRAGESRAEWSPGDEATTISILVRGRFVLEFEDREIVLAREGDYAFWDPHTPHTWRCEEDSTIVTVRWPSKR